MFNTSTVYCKLSSTETALPTWTKVGGTCGTATAETYAQYCSVALEGGQRALVDTLHTKVGAIFTGELFSHTISEIKNSTNSSDFVCKPDVLSVASEGAASVAADIYLVGFTA